MAHIEEYPSLLGFNPHTHDNKSDISTDNEERDSIENTPKKTPKIHAKNKTSLCKNYTLHGVCPYGPRCQFAHGPSELKTSRNQQCAYKTKLCLTYSQKGQCQFGERCNFIHTHPKICTAEERSLMFVNHPYLLMQEQGQTSRLMRVLEK